jgi:hypothetical protein
MRKTKANQHILFLARLSDIPPAVGTVTIPVAKYPLVSLDKSDLASATCNYASDTMIVSFKDEESYTVASADWATYG